MLTEQDESHAATTMDLSLRLGQLLARSQLTIGTAESCTGGLVASAITDVSGSSAWFDRGVVTYSNAAKQTLLGVDPVVFETHGAVSEACAVAMAAGAVQRFGVDVAISVSGIAGPGGESPGKPVGTVWIGWARRLGVNPDNGDSGTCITSDVAVEASVFLFSGDRCHVREQAVRQALRGTISLIDNTGT